MLYVKSIKLENFRCFEHVEVNIDNSATSAPWTLVTGDNASGKTTLLKAIALGLCDRSSAAGLLRESDSGYIRHDQTKSVVSLELAGTVDGRTVDGYRITTTFRRIDDKLEELDQETIPDHNFPWKDIFVCGYGAGRGTSGTGDIAGYTAISAVYNLFNYSEGLQNPELTIRRLEQDSARGTQILQSAEEILELRNLRLAGFAHSDSGINAIDPRGVSIALRDLADGYKSTFLWVTDFLGWAFANQNGEGKNLKGIVVIDELEQHLHPKWQRRIIPVLRRIWPHVQFFAATHSPLIARSFRSGAGNGPETDLHAHLHLRTSDNGKTVDCIAIPSLGGHRTDQILASEAFDYLIDDDPEAEALLSEYALLLGSEALTAAEQQRAQDIATGLQHIQAIRTGQTPYERSAAEWAEMTRAFVVERLNNTEGEAERDSD